MHHPEDMRSEDKGGWNLRYGIDISSSMEKSECGSIEKSPTQCEMKVMMVTRHHLTLIWSGVIQVTGSYNCEKKSRKVSTWRLTSAFFMTRNSTISAPLESSTISKLE
jgi:hypothetical protein